MNLGAWWREAARTAFFLPPRWAGLSSGAVAAALCTLALMGLAVGLERAYIAGPAEFYAPALIQGWMQPLVTAWLCWWLVGEQGSRSSATPSPMSSPTRASTAYTLLTLQSIVLLLCMAPLLITLARSGRWSIWDGSVWSYAPWAWFTAASALLLWRASARARKLRVAGLGVVFACSWLASLWQPAAAWYPARDAETEPPFVLEPAALEQQMALLPRQIDALAAQRPEAVDVYALTFAPYAPEDVFLRESRMVAEVMQQRFGAKGKTLQLINHRSTVAQWPWATPENLQRAIHGVAAQMDREQDILFIHLTSHGAQDGKLAAEFHPLGMPILTPELLKNALDAAGIKHRIISVSACYSGSWIAPLRNEHSLVLTAADEKTTSYGCGRRSELTFFGRALYDEALRRDTRDFEVAHAQARKVIEQREKEAGKDDGYSNPQIHMGAAMRQKLRALPES
jgi:hypothetical protein